MSPASIHLIPATPRTDALAGHTFAIPVVRELPRPATGLTTDRSTW